MIRKIKSRLIIFYLLFIFLLIFITLFKQFRSIEIISDNSTVSLNLTHIIDNNNLPPMINVPNIRFYYINPQSGVYLKKYQFHYCRIDKTMSTVMQVIVGR